MKYTNKERNISITCESNETRLLDYMAEELMRTLHKEWREFLEEVQVAIRTSKPGEKLKLYSKPITVEIEHIVDKPKKERSILLS